MIAGARVEVTPYKRNPMDFVLWKPSQPGEPAWPSPCGIATPGRPGWHIECSAMAWKYLGETFDIHGGGIDLVFPHHENEIAQTRCAFHSPVMANFWMHNGFLQVEGKKMAKSEGNFITIRELRSTKSFGGRKWSGGVLKFAMLQTHYRQPIDWTVRLLEQSESRLERWRSFAAERTVRRTNQNLMSEFLDALGDDLNTPAAFSIVDQVVDEEKGSDEDRYTVNRILLFLGIKTRKSRVARVAESIEILISELGNFSKHDWENLTSSASRRPILTSGNFKPETKLFTSLDALTSVWEEIKPPMEYAKWPISIEEFRNRLVERGKPTETEFEARVRRLISQREAARKAKDWAESDRIRDELQALGVVVKDSKEGPIWEILRR
jgi:cysteinyl-tRNA synthetase